MSFQSVPAAQQPENRADFIKLYHESFWLYRVCRKGGDFSARRNTAGRLSDGCGADFVNAKFVKIGNDAAGIVCYNKDDWVYT